MVGKGTPCSAIAHDVNFPLLSEFHTLANVGFLDKKKGDYQAILSSLLLSMFTCSPRWVLIIYDIHGMKLCAQENVHI